MSLPGDAQRQHEQRLQDAYRVREEGLVDAEAAKRARLQRRHKQNIAQEEEISAGLKQQILLLQSLRDAAQEEENKRFAQLRLRFESEKQDLRDAQESREEALLERYNASLRDHKAQIPKTAQLKMQLEQQVQKLRDDFQAREEDIQERQQLAENKLKRSTPARVTQLENQLKVARRKLAESSAELERYASHLRAGYADKHRSLEDSLLAALKLNEDVAADNSRQRQEEQRRAMPIDRHWFFDGGLEPEQPGSAGTDVAVDGSEADIEPCSYYFNQPAVFPLPPDFTWMAETAAVFPVTPVATQAGANVGTQQVAWFAVNDKARVVLLGHDQTPQFDWPLQAVRRYGCRDNLFSFELGPTFRPGGPAYPGELMFRSAYAKQLFDTVHHTIHAGISRASGAQFLF
eukprot:m.177269 g.177269  ORF g.177269 m.177269 type:complete len:404 (-) comp17960_c2_seq5:173-1384(-)